MAPTRLAAGDGDGTVSVVLTVAADGITLQTAIVQGATAGSLQLSPTGSSALLSNGGQLQVITGLPGSPAGVAFWWMCAVFGRILGAGGKRRWAVGRRRIRRLFGIRLWRGRTSDHVAGAVRRDGDRVFPRNRRSGRYDRYANCEDFQYRRYAFVEFTTIFASAGHRRPPRESPIALALTSDNAHRGSGIDGAGWRYRSGGFGEWRGQHRDLRMLLAAGIDGTRRVRFPAQWSRRRIGEGLRRGLGERMVRAPCARQHARRPAVTIRRVAVLLVLAALGALAAFGQLTPSPLPNVFGCTPPNGTTSCAVLNVAFPSTQLVVPPSTPAGTTWSISGGNAPPGLGVNGTTGVFSGTPTQAGLVHVSPITCRLLASSTILASQSYSIAIQSNRLFLTITQPQVLPNGVVGAAITPATFTATGGVPFVGGSGSYQWSIAPGSQAARSRAIDPNLGIIGATAGADRSAAARSPSRSA